MTTLLTTEEIETLTAKAATIPHPMEMVVDVLRAIQDRNGWVPDEGIELAARILGTSPLKVEEIATFYDKIYRQPVGRKSQAVACDGAGMPGVSGELKARTPPTSGRFAKLPGLVPCGAEDGLFPSGGSS